MLSREEIDKNYSKLKQLAQDMKNEYDFLYDVKRELGRVQKDISDLRIELIKEANDKEKHPELKNAEMRESWIKENIKEKELTEKRLSKEEEIMQREGRIKGIECEFRAIRIILETEAQLVATLYGKEKGW